jgi:LytS/YehU family sensor histidine kinase
MVWVGLLLRERAALRRALREAELRRLRTQINPHFLYNTLNAISELGYNDPAQADHTITLLGGLLRKALDDSDGREIRLLDELEFLDRYLEIQTVLLRDRLQATFEIDAGIEHARVPGMILQPLAENALSHGVRRDGVARLIVRARRDRDQLVIDVEDEGPGLGPRRAAPGIGLANVRDRIENLYGAAGRLELHNRLDRGLVARLIIPFHEAFAFDESPSPDRR